MNPEDQVLEEQEQIANALVAVGPPRAAAAVVQQRSPEMQRFDADMRYAIAFAKSRMFKGVATNDVQTGAAQAFVKIQAGKELGFPPMAAMRLMYAFDGNVGLMAPGLIALLQRSDKYEYEIVESTDQQASIDFFRQTKDGERGRKLGNSTFTIQEAQRAGLVTKDNWKMYPRQMLRWRALQDGVKMFCADITNGVPLAEEINPNAIVDAAGMVLTNAAGVADRIAEDNQAALPSAEDAEIQALCKRDKLNWTPAMLTSQLHRFDGDKTRLLAHMQAEWEKHSRGSRARAEREEQQATEPAACCATSHSVYKCGLPKGHDGPHVHAPPPAPFEPMTDEQRKAVFGFLNKRGIKSKPDRLAWAKKEYGLDIDSFSKISKAKASEIIDAFVAEENASPTPIEQTVVQKLRCDACCARHGETHAVGCPIDETDEPDDHLADEEEPKLL